MVNYQEAIKRPFTDWKKFGIGFILLLIPIVNIITAFIVRGYQLEAARTAMKKKYKLPEWKNFWLMFIKGILATIIWLLYFIPATIISVIIVLLTASTKLSELLALDWANPNTLIPLIPSFIPAILITILVFVLTMYLLPVATMNYVENWKFKNAFKIKSVFKKSFTLKYFVAVIFIIAYSIIASLISIIFMIIPVVGAFIGGALLGFILGVTSFTVLGEVYKELK